MFIILAALDFEFLESFHILKWEIPNNSKFKAFIMAERAVFNLLKSAKLLFLPLNYNLKCFPDYTWNHDCEFKFEGFLHSWNDLSNSTFWIQKYFTEINSRYGYWNNSRSQRLWKNFVNSTDLVDLNWTEWFHEN